MLWIIQVWEPSICILQFSRVYKFWHLKFPKLLQSTSVILKEFQSINGNGQAEMRQIKYNFYPQVKFRYQKPIIPSTLSHANDKRTDKRFFLFPMLHNQKETKVTYIILDFPSSISINCKPPLLILCLDIWIFRCQRVLDL